jgi:hypothetical protein
MGTHYVLRKANGQLLIIEIDGKSCVPVWESENAVRRSKRANPDLMVYVTAPLSRQMMERRFPDLNVSLFLVDSRDPDLETGHEISQAEAFGESPLSQAA